MRTTTAGLLSGNVTYCTRPRLDVRRGSGCFCLTAERLADVSSGEASARDGEGDWDEEGSEVGHRCKLDPGLKVPPGFLKSSTY